MSRSSKPLSLIVLVLLVVTGTVACGQGATRTSARLAYHVFEDRAVGCSFRYPLDYQLQSSRGSLDEEPPYGVVVNNGSAEGAWVMVAGQRPSGEVPDPARFLSVLADKIRTHPARELGGRYRDVRLLSCRTLERSDGSPALEVSYTCRGDSGREWHSRQMFLSGPYLWMVLAASSDPSDRGAKTAYQEVSRSLLVPM